MAVSPSRSALRRKVTRITELLKEHFGVPRPGLKGPPLDSLIGTILSQSTNDHNRDRAYASLRETFGELSLRALHQIDPDEACDLLCSQEGIGVKTAAATLLFACGRDILPVDTHVHRICRRLRVVLPEASAEKTHHLMAPLVPRARRCRCTSTCFATAETTATDVPAHDCCNCMNTMLL